MREIDRMIQDALRKEDAEMLEQVSGEQKMHQVILDLFRGRSRWLSIMAIVITLALMGIAVYAAIEFAQAVEMRMMFVWGAVALFCSLAVGAMKIWTWMEMAKNELMREVKRLELQIAYLANKLGKNQN